MEERRQERRKNGLRRESDKKMARSRIKEILLGALLTAVFTTVIIFLTVAVTNRAQRELANRVDRNVEAIRAATKELHAQTNFLVCALSFDLRSRTSEDIVFCAQQAGIELDRDVLEMVRLRETPE